MSHFHSSPWVDSLHENFKNGIPIGHKSINLSKKKYWHPLMSDFLLGIRHKTAIFNAHIIKKSILRAFYMIALVLKNNGHILIINTNQEYSHLARNLSFLTLQKKSTIFTGSHHQVIDGSQSLVNKYHHLYTGNISYCAYKWVGGTLTNWKQISKSVLTFAKFSERCENFLIRNNIDFPRYKKIKTYFQGLLSKKSTGQTTLAFYEKPDLIFLINPNENRNVIMEATKLHIPIVAFVESNTDIKGITYPIPVNIYSISFIYFCIKKIIMLALLSSNIDQRKN
nr:ribosomal protein L2 [Chlorella desiccata (nom. nud.)]